MGGGEKIGMGVTYKFNRAKKDLRTTKVALVGNGGVEYLVNKAQCQLPTYRSTPRKLATFTK